MSSSPIVGGAATGAAVGSAIPGLGTAAGAAIGAGVGLFQDVSGYFVGQHNAKQQYKYNKQLMDYQHSLNRADADYANWYNSPVEQRKRLAAAGLNPDLMYGNGAPLSTIATSPTGGSSVSAAPVPNGSMLQGALAALQMEQTASDVEVNKSVAALNKANEDKVKSTTPNGITTRLLYNSLFKQLGLNEDPDAAQVLTSAHISQQDLENILTYMNVLNSQQDFKRKSSDLSAAESQNALQKAIADGQLHNNEVLSSLVKMPLAEYTKIQDECRQIAENIGLIKQNVIESKARVGFINAQKENELYRNVLLHDEHTMNKLQYTINQASNLKTLLQQTLDPNTDLQTKIINGLLILGLVLGGLRR